SQELVVCSREVLRVPVGRSRCPMPPFFGLAPKRPATHRRPDVEVSQQRRVPNPKLGCPPLLRIVRQRGKEINMRMLIIK
ncbi:MAG: hypothetical protein M3441_26420, partial [Chloroflexota bacterium]|nr:hypothetical protein [Chloroflexota bacterium]